MAKTKTFQIDKAKQQDVCRSLAFLRKSDKFHDLTFVCGSNKNLVHGHIEIFKQVSPFLAKLFKIAREKQPYDPVYISITDVDQKTVQKLIDCLYLGQTTVNKKENVSLTDLIELLEMDMLLARGSSSTSNSSAEDSEEDVPKAKKIVRSKNKGSSSSSEQDSSSEDEIPAKASKKATPRPKSKMLNNKNSKTDDELLKKNAEEDKAKIRLERLEEKDVKKYMK